MSIDSNQALIRPFLRWAGSKRQILPEMSRYWNEGYSRYVEPFVGSACFFYRLRPNSALLGDINRDLISTYVEVKYRVGKVIEALSRLQEGKDQYYELREMDISELNKSERAARFIYLNRFCFNGLYRTNRMGKFNVPFGGIKSGSLPDERLLRDCSRTLKRAELIAGSFEKVLEKVRLGDFVYMDPPFSVRERRVFSEYNATSFGPDHLKVLRSWMERFAAQNIAFLVSYAECEEARLLYTDFYKKIVTVRRNIAGFTEHRKHTSEVLISSRPIEL